MFGNCKKIIGSFIYIQPSSFYLEGGKSQMKKGDEVWGIWSAILISAILSGFGKGFGGEVKG
jgi:hypothetical protein